MSLVNLVKNEKILMLSKKACINCNKLKQLLSDKNITYKTIVLEEYMENFDDDDFIFDDIESLKKTFNISSYPMLFIDGNFVGHYSEIKKMNICNDFNNYLKEHNIDYIDNDEDF